MLHCNMNSALHNRAAVPPGERRISPAPNGYPTRVGRLQLTLNAIGWY
jgi:hypothetical protein